MPIVAGVDFGTLSVRVSIVDSSRGLLASATASYPLNRKREDPEHATQSHDDHMRALASATRDAVSKAAVNPADVLAIAPNTAHGDELRAAVADAKQARRGLWGSCRSFGQPVGSSP